MTMTGLHCRGVSSDGRLALYTSSNEGKASGKTSCNEGKAASNEGKAANGGAATGTHTLLVPEETSTAKHAAGSDGTNTTSNTAKIIVSNTANSTSNTASNTAANTEAQPWQVQVTVGQAGHAAKARVQHVDTMVLQGVRDIVARGTCDVCWGVPTRLFLSVWYV